MYPLLYASLEALCAPLRCGDSVRDGLIAIDLSPL